MTDIKLNYWYYIILETIQLYANQGIMLNRIIKARSQHLKPLTVYKQLSFGSLIQCYVQTIHLQIIYLIHA